MRRVPGLMGDSHRTPFSESSSVENVPVQCTCMRRGWPNAMSYRRKSSTVASRTTLRSAGVPVRLAVALVPLYLLRDRTWYRSRVVVPVSVLAIAVAVTWFAERVFDFKLLPV